MSVRLSDKEPDGKTDTQENDECTDQAFVDAPKEQGAGIATERSSETKNGDAQQGMPGMKTKIGTTAAFITPARTFFVDPADRTANPAAASAASMRTVSMLYSPHGHRGRSASGQVR
jgi:hypothetical protein